MPGTTPTFGFPYPTAGDPINQGAEKVEALARAVEDKLRQTPGTPLAESVEPDPATLALRDAGGRVRTANPADYFDTVPLGFLNTRTGNTSFVRSSTPPPPGTPASTVTFVTE